MTHRLDDVSVYRITIVCSYAELIAECSINNQHKLQQLPCLQTPSHQQVARRCLSM